MRAALLRTIPTQPEGTKSMVSNVSTAYEINDGPKMLRETLCVAQTYVGLSDDSRKGEHIARLQRLIDECDRHRPLGRNGKHGRRQRCTATCGCEELRP